MTVKEIREFLFANRDEGYKAFQSPLIPTVPTERFIGVRTPVLRDLAKRVASSDDVNAFLSDLPHENFEENQLHAFVLSLLKPFDVCIEQVDRFLPYVDNWATCDQLSLKVFKKSRARLIPYVQKWLSSPHVYVVRFAIKVLMDHFLDEGFDPIYPKWVAAVKSKEYYIEMMVAWYFATALAKRYDEVLSYFTEGKLAASVHKKAVRKALESFRVTEAHKAFLRSLTPKEGE